MQDFSVRLTPGLTEYKPFFSGCGTGQSTFILSKYFDRVLGVDVSESQIKEARDPLLHLHLQFTNTSENRKRKKKFSQANVDDDIDVSGGQPKTIAKPRTWNLGKHLMFSWGAHHKPHELITANLHKTA